MKKRKRNNRDKLPSANIKVVGIGGGGGNAVTRMIKDFSRGVDFVAINTDHQDLDQCVARRKIYIGRNLTRGLGTGMNPDLGRQAAEENRSDIAEALEGADLVFIAAGLGGGTGTGAAPIVAEVAKQIGALALAFVTKPFTFEGSQRSRIAQEGLLKLKDKVDALVVIPNDRIFSIISKETPIIEAFEAIDDVLKNALRGIVELIVTPGLINVDFADVRSVVQDAGSAIVGLGIGSGEGRAANAVNQALNSPLLETSVEGARGILLGISGSRKLGMNDINEVAKMVAQIADPSARIIFGAYYDRHLRANQLKVTLIATGFEGGVPTSSLFGSSFRERESSKQGFLGSSPIMSQPRLEEAGAGKGNPSKTPPAERKQNKKSEQAEAKK
ncbi:MAG: cell division protein FtsZ, partial [Candidatus Liptonbacteria bacterium]|nr:cell division protein FtsZ [Candidatus Liptonbacteria bacterium]